MKINTDIVKTKRFNTAIEPCLLKHSQEYRVLATLRYLYPERFDKMVIGESPDLQDCENSVGIEVTAAVNPNDMRASRAFSEMYQGEVKEIEKRKKAIESSGYSFVPLVDGKVAVSVNILRNIFYRFFSAGQTVKAFFPDCATIIRTAAYQAAIGQ